MNLFIVRVELHGAQSHHHATLAQKLAQSSVTDVIVARDGSKWKLPPAEYVYQGNATIDQVLQTVKATANSVVASNAVLVSQADSVKWDGLQQARQYA